ncbi:MAG: tetratricopeptide repeat protein [Candidatus Omnitrophica bacterium]|nr:tetratricopeptide repeat protein [Candidatus Omnitrophota bacterium]MDD5236115.1 tetratricopeptide repeat protein [Candidatus Omnitrophota bacterium]MDD5610460.1 tetratricopeptide repeat protein [Candidatus Omnitrophota bacterium]
MKKTLFLAFLFCLSVHSVFAHQATKEEEALVLASKAFNDGFYDVSLGILDNFLEDDPATERAAEVNLNIGKCYLYQGKISQAKNKFEGLFGQENAKDIQDALCYWLGEAYFKEKNIPRSNEYYRKIIAEYPQSGYLLDAYYAYGLGLLELKDFSKAADIFNILKEKISAGDEKIAYVNFYLGETLYYQNDFPAAEAFYRAAMESALDLKAKSLFTLSLAWDELKLKKYTEARTLFEQIDFAQLDERNQQVFKLGEGALLTAENKFENALSLYADLLNISRDADILTQASLGRADCLFNLGKYQDALLAYRSTVTSLDPEKKYSYQLLYGLAWANLKNGNFKEAINEFQKVADASDDSMVKNSALCQVADAYQDEGKFAEALCEYEAILKEFPSSPYRDYVEYQRAQSLFRLARYDEAMQVLDKFRNDFKDSVLYKDSLCLLGKVFYNQGSFSEAIACFNQVLDEAPEEERPGLNFQIAQCYQDEAKSKEAVEAYLKITSLCGQENPLFVKALLRVAQIYENSGQLKEAKSVYQRIMSINVQEADYAKEKYAALGE